MSNLEKSTPPEILSYSALNGGMRRFHIRTALLVIAEVYVLALLSPIWAPVGLLYFCVITFRDAYKLRSEESIKDYTLKRLRSAMEMEVGTLKGRILVGAMSGMYVWILIPAIHELYHHTQSSRANEYVALLHFMVLAACTFPLVMAGLSGFKVEPTCNSVEANAPLVRLTSLKIGLTSQLLPEESLPLNSKTNEYELVIPRGAQELQICVEFTKDIAGNALLIEGVAGGAIHELENGIAKNYQLPQLSQIDKLFILTRPTSEHPGCLYKIKTKSGGESLDCTNTTTCLSALVSTVIKVVSLFGAMFVLTIGLLHNLIPYFYAIATGQGYLCVLPLPQGCAIPCVNDIGFDAFDIPWRITYEYIYSNGTTATLGEPSDMDLFRYLTGSASPDEECPFIATIGSFGVLVASLIYGLLVLTNLGALQMLYKNQEILQDLCDLIQIYTWPFGSKSRRQADFVVHLEKIRPVERELVALYGLSEYPMVPEKGVAPGDVESSVSPTDSAQLSLAWWFTTRSAVCELLESQYLRLWPALIVSFVSVIGLIVVVLCEALSNEGKLPQPDSIYAVVNLLFFGFVFLAVVFLGANVNANLTKSLDLISEKLQRDEDKQLLQYATQRPFQLTLLGLKFDRAFVLSYGSSVVSYGLVIFMTYGKNTIIPLLRAGL